MQSPNGVTGQTTASATSSGTGATAPSSPQAGQSVQVSSSTQAAVSSQRFAVAMDDIEMDGPFPSWANAKTDYGAKGDGVTDDAPALQRALNDLGHTGKASILYLPPGTYKIGATLYLNGSAMSSTDSGAGGVSIIGNNPSNTKIVWAGPAGGAMLVQDGGFKTRYARITWDGQGKAGYGIAHWWNTSSNTYHDASSEDVDEVFQDMGIGIMAGRLGANYGQLNSEGTIRRVTFLRNSYAGLDTGSWNAVDWWVWDSHFVDCARGVTNLFTLTDTGSGMGAGAFYVYRSLFERSSVSDVDIGNTGWFSLHANVSIGSRRFFQAPQTGASASVIIKGNRILDVTAPDAAAIVVGNVGPLMLIDNQIRSPSGTSSPAVVMNELSNGGDIVSVGNTYTVSNPISRRSVDRLVEAQDQTVSRTSISSASLTLPATPAMMSRQVFEVAANGGSAEIQAAIDAAVKAAASGAPNPVVHLPPGRYPLASTLTVPAKARIQIVGDGLTTALVWNGADGGVMLQLQGPSYATVSNLFLIGGNALHTARGIQITSADQDGGRIFIENSTLAPLSASGLVKTQLTAQSNPGFASINLSATKNFVSIGAGGLGPVNLSNQSTGMIVDSWYEGSATDLFRMNDGTFTYLGGQIGPASHPGATDPNSPAILLNGFSGTASFMGFGMYLAGVPSGIGIQVGTETSSTNAMFMGVGSASPTFFNRTSSGGNVGLIAGKTSDSAGHTILAANQGTTDTTFVLKMLAQARSLKWDSTPYVAPAGATDVRLYRVFDSSMGLTISN